MNVHRRNTDEDMIKVERVKVEFFNEMKKVEGGDDQETGKKMVRIVALVKQKVKLEVKPRYKVPPPTLPLSPLSPVGKGVPKEVPYKRPPKPPPPIAPRVEGEVPQEGRVPFPEGMMTMPRKGDGLS